MKRSLSCYCAAAAILALPLALVGCDREVSRTSSNTIRSDGATKSKEKVVTQSPDGTVTKEETKTSTPPTAH